jgi:phosphate transport system permease protein
MDPKNFKDWKYFLITSLSVVFTIGLILFLLTIIMINSWTPFWPGEIRSFYMKTGLKYLGRYWDEEVASDQKQKSKKIQIEIGNRDIYYKDFVWINETEIDHIEIPKDVLTIERWNQSNFYGYLYYLNFKGKYTQQSQTDMSKKLEEALSYTDSLTNEIQRIKLHLDVIRLPLIDIQRKITKIQKKNGDSIAPQQSTTELIGTKAELEKDIQIKSAEFLRRLELLEKEQRTIFCEVKTIEGTNVRIFLSDIIRVYYPNSTDIGKKLYFTFNKVKEFLFAGSRKSNTAGGIFPAILGTVLLVFLMTLLVCPLGVLTAFYLTEYSRPGIIINLIRTFIYNLAGIPSIVFGMFGLGFFIYGIGGSLDELFFSDNLPQPTLGTGSILWSSLTMALLTLPVVIVTIEDGIRSVSRQYKEAAIALGASQWQIIKRILLPRTSPVILTAGILSISRAAGEVAPLMLTGVVKLAPRLPIEPYFPYLHLERKFMHLGFLIYDLGFQSQNVMAALPHIMAVTLVLVTLITGLNFFAFYVRNHLRKQNRSLYL